MPLPNIMITVGDTIVPIITTINIDITSLRDIMPRRDTIMNHIGIVQRAIGKTDTTTI